MEPYSDFEKVLFSYETMNASNLVNNCEMENIIDTPKPRHVVNARERCRNKSIYSVNTAFDMLRTLIPTEPYDRKLSKIEILRLAKSYIKHLDAIMETGIMEKPCRYRVNQNIENPDTCHRPSFCTFCATVSNAKS